MKTWKKVLAMILALAMVIPGVCLGESKVKEVKADEQPTTSSSGSYITKKKSEVTMDEKDIPILKGYLFAGWFDSEECTSQSAITGGEPGNDSYAKFVPADVLSVKGQSTPADQGYADVIRFVSSVDSLDYYKVGFEVTYTVGEGEEAPKNKLTNTTSTVYEHIASTTEGAEFKFDPKVIDIESQYFITAKLDIQYFEDIAADTNLTVRAFWITLDKNTKVYGPSRCINLNDGRSDETINLSFERDGSEVGKADTLAVTYKGGETTATVIDVDGTTVHVRIEGIDTLKSATYFEFSKDENVVGSTVYRYYYTEYKGDGTADSTWYTAYVKDAGETSKTDFIIATNAELYGLAEIVNAASDDERDSFAGKAVYLVADIATNKGTATEDEWVPAEDGGTGYLWTPIGSTLTLTFQGTFDGGDHTISGIYARQTTVNTTNGKNACGLFGCTAYCTIKNLRLENSYLYSAALGLGSIVGYGDGDFINIYSSANLKSSAVQAGGIIGRVQNAFKNNSIKADTNCNLANCWYDGKMTFTASNAVNGGGLVGMLQVGTLKVNNSLFTGAITCADGGSRIGGLQGSQSTSPNEVEYTNCVSIGTLSSTSATAEVGSAVGRVQATTTVKENVYVSAEYSVYGSLNTNDPKVTPTVRNFTQAGIFREVEQALNANVAENNNNADVIWDTWEEYNGQLVLQSLDPQKPIEVTPDENWYDSSASSLVIWDAADLFAFAEARSSSSGNKVSFINKTITLGASIKVNYGDAKTWGDTAPINANWTPICEAKTPFRGIFDGAGNTISGIYMKTESNYAGLFGYMDESGSNVGTIQNLRLENSYFEYAGTEANAYLGSIVGGGNSVIRNVYSDAILVSVGNQVGGLVGTVSKAAATCAIENCWFNGEIHMIGENAVAAGGMVGELMASSGTNANITNCLNSGLISSERKAKDVRIGGICGITLNNTNLNVTNCVNAGAFEITSGEHECIGAILGRCGTTSTTCIVKSTYLIADSYRKNTVGIGGAKGEGEAVYEADASTLISYLNDSEEPIWTVGTVNGKEIPVLISLKDVLD